MKKLLTILLLIMLIISFFQIANMYALYKEELQGEYTNLLGIWSIKVNGVDISSGGENLTFDMSENNLTYIDSQLIKNGKIAPGGQACFEIAIDPSDTDVSILYTLSIKLSSATIKVGDDNSQSVAPSMKLVKIENYFQKDGEKEKVTNETAQMGEETETALIPIGKIKDKYINHIKVYFEWINSDENNEIDSILGNTENVKIKIPLEINLKQYTGEGINNETNKSS